LRLALIIELFAARQSQFKFGAAFFIEIKLQRNERHPLAFDCTDEFVDLAAVQQQLARSLRRMIETIGLQIFRNIGVDQPDLAAARIRI